MRLLVLGGPKECAISLEHSNYVVFVHELWL